MRDEIHGHAIRRWRIVSMKNRVLTVAAIAAVALGMSSNAAAQAPAASAQPAAQIPSPQTTNPTYELSLGYQGVYVDDPATIFPGGIALDAARNWGAFGIVVEGGWAINIEGESPDKLTQNLWHVGAGPRWMSRGGSVWPYFQVLAGALVDHKSGDIAGVDVGDSATHFMVQPGGGVNFVIGDGVGFFIAADYRRVMTEEDVDGNSGRNEARLFLGFRMILD